MYICPMNINTNTTHKKCPRCKQLKSRDLFYTRKNEPVKVSSYCIICTKERATEDKQKSRLQALNYLGGKCSNCGYNKCNAALEFHHTNSTEKDIKYENFRQNVFNDKLKKELDKCVILCSNCHREHHSSNP